MERIPNATQQLMDTYLNREHFLVCGSFSESKSNTRLCIAELYGVNAPHTKLYSVNAPHTELYSVNAPHILLYSHTR